MPEMKLDVVDVPGVPRSSRLVSMSTCTICATPVTRSWLRLGPTLVS
jgi:hypothetical protein